MIYEQILGRIEVQPSGCWEWPGAHLASGYGSVRFEGKSRVLHRIIWEQVNGPVPDGLQLDHVCRNRGCCNPAHLEAVTQAENMRRGVGPSAMNSRKNACPNGHPYDLVSARGGRGCSACKKDRRRKHYEANSVATRPAANERTECPQGHPYSVENTYISPQGYRKCRTCRAAQRRAHWERTGR